MTDRECIGLLIFEASRHDCLAMCAREEKLADDHRAVAEACRRGARSIGGRVCRSERKRPFARLRFWMSAGRRRGKW